ncbi:MAG: serine/threonine-protein kinase [Acidobacteria bacterium]|nr:serine/threonine-protein kinase [Acidobacteriota bacterium]
MIGKTLAHYEITSQLGKGGMGEVYRAKDRKLGRDVAIKVLPEEFARDPERVARFEREAKLLASLNHPNIASIHGLEEAGGTHFLVMELVEGNTLADQLKQGAIPVEESLKLALQIAEALEAAHEKGVIHRDLKPANIKITPDGKVKVLDFGLAKAFAAEQADLNLSNSPTLSNAATQQGIILGTAAYMSPEQARGKPVDKRADIWAFGVVLFEMLTGRQLFGGDTISDTLASVLTREPEWEKVPVKARSLLRRCLEKDPKKRLRDIGDAYALLETAPESPPVKKSRLSWGIAGALALALAISLCAPWRSKPPASEPMRLQIAYPDKVTPGQIGGFALSPDGRHLAFVAMDSDGIRRLWVRDLQSFEIRFLAGTESANDEVPFWSPDNRSIAFDAGGKLKKVDISGGPPTPLCNLSGGVPGGSWNGNDVIIFGTDKASGGIMQVSAAGGTALPVTRPVPERQETSHVLPTFLPDGRHFLYCINSDNPENTGVYIGSLDARPEEQPVKRLMASSLAPQYIPPSNTTPGMLLFQQGQKLVAQPFDDRRLELIGDDPVPIADQIGAIWNYSYFSASANGILIYRSSSSQVSQPAWFDRQGKTLGREALKGRFGGLALSPDGTRAAISRDSSRQQASFFPTVDIWLLVLARDTKSRFSHGSIEWRTHPIWSPDGTRIAFSSDFAGGMVDIYIKPTSGIGNEELLLTSNEHKAPTSWSRDGRILLYTAIGSKTGSDIWVLPMRNGGKQMPVLQGKSNERDGCFSPDMRWIAYVSDETDRDEVYVCGFSQSSTGEFLATAGKHQISQGGGTEPRWRRDDGKELFYRVPEGKVVAVEVNAGTEFAWGKPEELFPAPADLLALRPSIDVSTWDVTADGKRFLLITPLVEGSPTPFNVVLNWTELLKK